MRRGLAGLTLILLVGCGGAAEPRADGSRESTATPRNFAPQTGENGGAAATGSAEPGAPAQTGGTGPNGEPPAGDARGEGDTAPDTGAAPDNDAPATGAAPDDDAAPTGAPTPTGEARRNQDPAPNGAAGTRRDRDAAPTDSAATRSRRGAETPTRSARTPTQRRTRTKRKYFVAALTQPSLLRSRPGGQAIARADIKTEFGSPTVLSVLARRDGWVKVLHPELGNNRAAWMPAENARLQTTGYKITIDRSKRRARLTDGGRTVMRFTVAIGRPGNETPLGRYGVTDKLRPQDPASPYGCCAVALTGRQPKLVPGWPGGDRLAIHNTPARGSVGQAASLGCLRAALRPMRRLMRVLPLGTPVVVR